MMRKIDPKGYSAIFNPVLNRREALAMEAFRELNRERGYLSSPIGSLPETIKKRDIHEYWTNSGSIIKFDFLVTFIRALDDVFISYSMEQLKKNG